MVLERREALIAINVQIWAFRDMCLVEVSQQALLH